MAENTASSGLFAVFMLSIYSLFLIPYTIYRFCSAGEDVTTQPVVKVSSKLLLLLLLQLCHPQQMLTTSLLSLVVVCRARKLHHSLRG